MSASAALGAVYAAASPWALAGIVGACGLLATRHYRAFPAVGAEPDARLGDAGTVDDAPSPRVSIIVPARNEERNLPPLLDSLLTLDYPAYEVIVVDDDSTDATAAVVAEYMARSNGRIRLIHGDGPPPGWTGKNAACYRGAQFATGTWLLFTDADTQHGPASLRAAIRVARHTDTRALSLFPQQHCGGFWERLLLPFAYQQYFIGARFHTVTAARGPALANGQYFLIEREAYELIDGHAAIAGSIIDDVALAGALKRSGVVPLPYRGESLVRIRMYSGFATLAEGFAKNSTQFLREQRLAGLLVVLSTACSASIVPAALTAAAAGRPVALAGACVAYLVQVGAFAPWLRAFGVPLRYSPLAPLAAIAFTAIALSSLLHTLTRTPVRWKGRRYSARSAQQPAQASQAHVVSRTARDL